MQSTLHEDHKGQCSVIFMPLINYNPSEVSCIYTTLLFICEQASLQYVTPVVTFNQSLYYKAVTIAAAEPSNSPIRNMIIMIGGLHIRMSYL